MTWEPNPEITPYCDLETFLANPMGADLETFGNTVSNADEELEAVIEDATVLADEFCKTTYQYQARAEMKNWRGSWDKRWEVIPSYGPIRTVTDFRIGVSVMHGQWTEFTVNCQPPEPNPMGPYPTAFGEVFVNRQVGYIQTTYIMLKYGMGAAYLATPANPPQVRYAYTAGYNAPNADPATLDGYSFPFPAGLVKGTKIIAAYLVNEHNLTQLGLGNIDAIRIGDRSIRRHTGSRNLKGEDIPDLAKLALKRYRRSRFA